MSKILHPQNYLCAHKKNCFEGWYFRHTEEFPFSFIAGVSKHKGTEHAFIQYIDRQCSRVFRFPLSAFSFSKKDMSIKIEGNIFSIKGIDVSLFDEKNDKFAVKCQIKYDSITPFKKSLYAPSIMGPFAFLPLPCCHALVSMSHCANGTLDKNGEKRDINAKGYIEKDYGRHFPPNYVWLHASAKDTSIAAAVAYPVAKRRGFFCLISHNGKQHNLSLYNFARLKLTAQSLWDKENKDINMIFKKGDTHLSVTVKTSDHGQKLLAPDKHGEMTREVCEDLSASFNGKLVIEGEEIDIFGISHCAFETAGELNLLS
ncbi:MAG: hypothetical protein FWE84_00360 [Firmicutes bacterium]|nr:hypothetical protein [Bacillota bacterium]